jgi:hypothetical protein
MARKQQPTEPKRTTLQVPRSEAEARIREQIEKGQKLLELQIRTEAELEQARNEETKWSDFNKKLLRSIADTDELVNDYRSKRFISSRSRNLAGRAKRFYSCAERNIASLESILNYLPLMPESPALAQPADEVEIVPKPKVVPFVSMSFDEADRDINNYVTGILDALQIDFETGERYSKESIPQKVESRIRSSGLFIVIFVRRDKIESGGYTTPAWLLKELGLAQGAQKDVIAWVERGIKDIAGLNYEKEVIYFERDSVKEMKKATIKFLEALKEHNLV